MIDTSKYEGLEDLAGFPFTVKFSAGCKEKVRTLAERSIQASRFLKETLSLEPQFALIVLSLEDWTTYADDDLAYGLPHYTNGKIFVAGQESPLAQGFASLFGMAPDPLLAEMQAIYGNAYGQIDLTSALDLFVVHEMAHSCERRAPSYITFPRLWLSELFANLCMYSYVAACEPELLPILQTAPRIFTTLDLPVPYQTLTDFEALYTEVGAENYGWYQMYLLVAARRVYDAGGLSALQRLWKTFQTPDAQLASLLQKNIHPELAQIFLDWPA
jgi:hypothetical protein